MKNDIHHLGEEHKKKKNFFVYVENQKIKKNYSDYTLKKVAKKVAKDLLGSKEKIIFHLEEKGKSGKTYGPYIGSQKGQKIEVKTYKMSGGLNGEIKNKIPGNSNRIPGNSNRIPGNLEKPIQETFTLSAESISEGNRANRILHQNSTINPNSARARNNVAQAAQLAANAANSALLAVNEAQQTNNPGAKLAAANALNTTANVIANITSNNALLAVNAAQQANNQSTTNVLQQTNNQGEQLAAAANALNTATNNALLVVNAAQQINNQGVKMHATNNLNAAVSSLSIAANNMLNSN
jgi:hypothetical protein